MKNKLIKFFHSPITSHQPPARHASQPAGVVGRLSTTRSSERGFMFVAIIFIVIIIFSISIVSGADDFAFSPEPTGKPTPTTSPTATPIAGTITTTTTPTPTPDPSAGWSITYTFSECVPEIIPVAKGQATAVGTAIGYVDVEVSNGSAFQKILSLPFNPTTSNYELELSNNDGFSSNPWRINIYSEGTQSGGAFSGVTLQNTFNGTPTGC